MLDTHLILVYTIRQLSRIRGPIKTKHQSALRDLRTIPGVGPSIAQDLYEWGIREVADLKDADPEDLYERRCVQQGAHIDRCLLYVFRCAVYFASTPRPQARLLKWWNWKDQPAKGANRGRLARAAH
jgi:hypothetical protein